MIDVITKLSTIEQVPFIHEVRRATVIKIPVVVRDKQQPPPDRFPHHWLSYPIGVPGFEGSEISFLRTAATLFPSLYLSFVSRLRCHFDFATTELLPNRFQIIRTLGSSGPHVDEDRTACISMGVIRSKAARTYISDSSRIKEFNETATVHQVEDGDLYMMDASKLHCFSENDPKQTEYRYLLTQSFSMPYAELQSRWKV